MNPSYRLTPQTLGTGRTTKYIDFNYTLVNTDLQQVQLSSFLNSDEFKISAVLYRYMKVVGINIAIQPSYNSNNLYFLMRWTDDIGGNNIKLDDNTKIIGVMSNRVQKFVYRIPNLCLPLNAGAMKAINVKSWLVIDDLLNTTYQFPGNMLVKADSANTVYFKITMKIVFRSSKIPDAAKLSDLARSLGSRSEEGKLLKSNEEKEKENNVSSV